MYRKTSAQRRSRSIQTILACLHTRAEDLGELVGRRHLQLVVAAVAGRLVEPEAQEGGGVAEAVSLQVVVLDLAHALDAQRLPRQILARAPAALASGHT